MNTPRHFRPAGRRWVAIFLTLFFLLATNVVAAAAPPKIMPGITIESPTATTVSGTVTVQAQVPGNPAMVQYKIDGRAAVKMKKTADGKWSAAWDTRTVPYGQHTVMVFASGVNYRPLTATVKVTVDNHTPSITVVKPVEGATVSGKVTLQARVNDAIPGTTVTYTVGADGTQQAMTLNATTGYFEAPWDTSALPEGDVTLLFRSNDSTGKSATATRTVTVVPPQPVPPQESGDWTHSRGDLAGRAYTAEDYGTSFTQLWTATSLGGAARLAIYNGILYSATDSSPGYLTAFNATTGRTIFSLRMEGTIGPVAVGPDAAYVSVWNTAVVAVKPDGTTLWRSAIRGSSPPLVTPEGILVGDMSGKVYALDSQTGAIAWSVQTGETSGFRKDMIPVYADGRLYVPGQNGVTAIDVSARQIAFTISGSPADGPMYDRGLLYVVRSSLTAYDGATGVQRWTYRAPDYLGSPAAVANGIVVFGTDETEPKISAVDGATGQLLWSQQLDTYGSAYGSPVIAGNLVYMGAYFGGVKVFDLQTGAYQTTLMPGKKVPYTAVPYGGVLYLSTTQSFYALKPQ